MHNMHLRPTRAGTHASLPYKAEKLSVCLSVHILLLGRYLSHDCMSYSHVFRHDEAYFKKFLGAAVFRQEYEIVTRVSQDSNLVHSW